MASAMVRQVQCVLPPGGLISSVLCSSVMSSSSSMERGLPGLRSSYRPIRPWVRKRSRHLPTVWRLVRTLSATAWLSQAVGAQSHDLGTPHQPGGQAARTDKRLELLTGTLADFERLQPTSPGHGSLPRSGGWRERYPVPVIMSRYVRGTTLARPLGEKP